MMDEISRAMPPKISMDEKRAFSEKVIDRFSNPYLNHKWLGICMNYSSKMAARCLPLITSYVQKNKEIPKLMALGFSAHLAFLKPVLFKDNTYYGQLNDENYIINDPNASFFFEIWASTGSLKAKIKNIIENEKIWGENLNNLDSFVETIYNTLSTIEGYVISKTLSEITHKEVKS
jgi:tagaturonate reductase